MAKKTAEETHALDLLIPSPWVIERKLALPGLQDKHRDILLVLLLLSREWERQRDTDLPDAD